MTDTDDDLLREGDDERYAARRRLEDEAREAEAREKARPIPSRREDDE